MELVTIKVNKEVMGMQSKVQVISKEEVMKNELEDALARSEKVCIEKEIAMELVTFKMDKEVMGMQSKVQVQEEFLKKELEDALDRSEKRCMENYYDTNPEDTTQLEDKPCDITRPNITILNPASSRSGWPFKGRLCGGQPPKPRDMSENDITEALHAESPAKKAKTSDEQYTPVAVQQVTPQADGGTPVSQNHEEDDSQGEEALVEGGPAEGHGHVDADDSLQGLAMDIPALTLGTPNKTGRVSSTRITEHGEEAPTPKRPRTNKVSVITPLQTPKKTADHNLLHTPDILSHTPVQQPLEHPRQGTPEPQAVDCVDGSLPGVIFLGRAGCRNWDKSTLKSFFFILPAYEQIKVVTLRADQDCSFEYIFQQVLSFYRREHNLLLSNPILSCEGRPVPLEQFLSSKLEKTVFLIHEGTIPDEVRSHQGKVWQCRSCDGAWTSSWKKSAKCEHVFWFFPGQLDKSTGHTLDRPNQMKPWGCPTGHNGPAHLLQQGVPAAAHNPVPSTAPQPANSGRPRTATLIRTPVAGSSRAPQPITTSLPRAPRSPSPNRSQLTIRRLEYVTPDLPTLSTMPPSSSKSSPAPSKPVRAAKSRANKKLEVTDKPQFSDDSCGEDISGDDSDGDKEYNVDESGSDETDQSEFEEEQEITVKETVPQTDDEQEDEEDDRLARRAVKESLLQEIEENLNKEGTIRSNYYDMDREDALWLNEHIVAPILKKGQLWMKYGHDAAADIVNMVKSGRTPKKGDKVQRALFSSTACIYLRGLKQLLGLYQQELISAGMDNLLIEGQLKVRQFFSIKQPTFLELPQNIERLLDQMLTGNAKNRAFSGFMQLVGSVRMFCNIPQGQKLFFTRTDEQIELSEGEMKKVAKKERMEMKEELKQLMDDMTLEKPFGKHTGQKNADVEKTRKFADVFENYRLPDPQVVIPKFLACEETR